MVQQASAGWAAKATTIGAERRGSADADEREARVSVRPGGSATDAPGVAPDWPGKLACVGGVALGTGGWFVGLSWVVSLGHGKFSEKTLLRMEHLSGIGLLASDSTPSAAITTGSAKSIARAFSAAASAWT